jgi:hypothetical protein
MRPHLPLAIACLAAAFNLAPDAALGHDLVVRADAGCVRTGVSVRRGQQITVSAIGTATYGQEGAPVNAAPVTTPEGQRFLTHIPAGVIPNDRPIEGLFPIGPKIDTNALLPGPVGALVGRVGAQGKPFYLGAQRALRMPAKGMLFLCYNDVPGTLDDNTGGYRAVIYR